VTRNVNNINSKNIESLINYNFWFYGAGIEQLLNFISHYIDMRLVKVHTSWKKLYNKEKPHLYNYWQALPEEGKLLFFYTAGIRNL